ncbi:hypothetical protein EGW08_018388 [Elysia chlorotica]|uniref:G-protein coupled receptors family 1 profile domain-containing protein n=1 Tax=Elysia chlorotica TaxID=188477 RepID=A0A3S1B329_ELYCH|nr:hypothetical protein EGW08_018388 [Elysia chlorotica]
MSQLDLIAGLITGAQTAEPIQVQFDLDIPSRVFSFLMENISYWMVAVAMFGMTSNIFIIVTFAKMGFSESINISYCALCISDILCVATFTWNAICFIPAFVDLDLPFLPSEVVVITGGALSDTFSKTTAWITAFISLERCLCVVFPLRVKDIVGHRRTIFIVVTIFVLTILPLTSVTFYISVFDNKLDLDRNRTLVGVRYRTSALANVLYDMNFVYKLVFMNTAPLFIVLVCSVSMAVQLSRSAFWRLQQSGGAVSQDSGGESRAERKYLKDIRVAKTVLAIATCFIVLETLGTIKVLVSTTWQDFRPVGAYSRTFKLVSRLAFLLSLTNSSVNFVIYYNMGSRFRHTVKQLVVFNRQKPPTKV